MKKLLVTGASGFLGWNLCRLARSNWQVCGTYFSQEIAIDDVRIDRVNLRDFSQLRNYFQAIRPDAVVHTAACSQPNFCQNHPEESYEVNVIASGYIADLCAEANIPLVFTSTDLVFNGLNPPYRETDPVCPINIYGEQKVEAERLIHDRLPSAIICRMPLMFGAVPPTATTFIQPFLDTLKAGGTLSLFVDEFRTPVSGTTAAKGLLLALESGKTLLHLGGKERISRYDFGRLLASVWGFPDDRILACRQADVPMAAPRSPDVSMDSSLARSIGYPTISLLEELEGLRDSL
ncbi:MAG TPA: NAD(P)-dependent oxidoreductase [Oscillatoriales cyanobacterium M59_W2019_021]|nr:MAG: NAD(P)-dependent oxidoreductase [Cyanobacteria bacterium J055]HIK33694.1 NAD(P)-dependent oxidoreductase [Oscillatoriales cyanobacterium M4454_W2019_049]HIK52908.1 NAD(P)-dependent oxidoreductase [Oscillatoriales cyanobacterium M59_W2019_021]